VPLVGTAVLDRYHFLFVAARSGNEESVLGRANRWPCSPNTRARALSGGSATRYLSVLGRSARAQAPGARLS